MKVIINEVLDYSEIEDVYLVNLSEKIIKKTKQKVREAIDGLIKIHYDNSDKVIVLKALKKELGL